MAESLPILVERFEKGQSLIIACEHCGFEEALGPDDICADGYSCERCGKRADYKYYEGEQCKNCGKLDFYFSDHLRGCCSRPCMLQVEYKAELDARKAA